MSRNLAFVASYVTVLVLLTAAVSAAQYGTPEEAKAMLERAVAAVKEDNAKALDMLQKGEGGFKDRDLYVACANASNGVVTAHPYLRGENLQDIKGKKGYPLGQEMMQKATEGTIKRGHVLVAAPWLRQGIGENYFLHESRRSDLQRGVLQGITCRTLMSAYGT